MSSKRGIRRRVCGKKVRHAWKGGGYTSINKLVKAGRARPGELVVYQCSFCRGWHVGHPPRSGGLRPS